MPKIQRPWKIAIKTCIGVVLIYFLAQRGMISIQATQKALVQWHYSIPALIALTVSTLLMVYRWQLLLNAQKIHLPFVTTLKLTFIGLFFNVALPGAVSGDIIKAIYLAREAPQRKEQALSSILFDRVAAVSTLVMLSMLAFVLVLQQSWSGPLVAALKLTVALSGGAVASFYAYLFWARPERDPTQGLLKRLASKHPRFAFLSRVYCSLMDYRSSWKEVVGSLVVSWIIHTLIIFSCIFFSRALGEGELPVLAMFVAVPIGLVVSTFPLLPGGIGTGHVAFAALFQLFGSARGADVFSLYLLFILLQGAVGGLVYLRFKSRNNIFLTASLLAVVLTNIGCGGGYVVGQGLNVRMVPNAVVDIPAPPALRALSPFSNSDIFSGALSENTFSISQGGTGNLIHLKYLILSVDLCKEDVSSIDFESEDPGDSLGTDFGCFPIFRNPSSDDVLSFNFLESDAIDDERFINVADRTQLETLFSGTATAFPGEYPFGVIRWNRAFIFRGSLTLPDGTILTTPGVSTTIEEDVSTPLQVDSLVGPSEDSEPIALRNSKIGTWFKFQTPFVITEEDLKNDLGYVVDLIFNLDRTLVGMTGTDHASANVIDNAGYSLELLPIRPMPVPRRSDENAIKETYTLFSNATASTAQFATRLEIYSIEQDAEKKIYAADIVQLLTATTGQFYGDKATLSVHTIETAEDGSLEFLDQDGNVLITGFNRIEEELSLGSARINCNAAIPVAITAEECPDGFLEFSARLEAITRIQ